MKLNWKYKCDNAVLYEGRSVDTLEDTFRLVNKPEELRVLLRIAGADKSYSRRIVKNVFEGGQNATHI